MYLEGYIEWERTSASLIDVMKRSGPDDPKPATMGNPQLALVLIYVLARIREFTLSTLSLYASLPFILAVGNRVQMFINTLNE